MVAFLAARIGMSPLYQDEINLETHQFGRKLGKPSVLPLRISVFGGDVLSFYVTTLAQSHPNSFGTGGVTSCIAPREISYPGNFLRLLRRCLNPTEHECEHDSEDPHPFSILDFRFPIVGDRVEVRNILFICLIPLI